VSLRAFVGITDTTPGREHTHRIFEPRGIELDVESHDGRDDNVDVEGLEC